MPRGLDRVFDVSFVDRSSGLKIKILFDNAEYADGSYRLFDTLYGGSAPIPDNVSSILPDISALLTRVDGQFTVSGETVTVSQLKVLYRGRFNVAECGLTAYNLRDFGGNVLSSSQVTSLELALVPALGASRSWCDQAPQSCLTLYPANTAPVPSHLRLPLGAGPHPPTNPPQSLAPNKPFS